MENKTIKVIKSRVSCKSYDDKKISLSKIQQIAECGKLAPTARNEQIANILVVKDKRNVEKLKDLSMELFSRDCFYGASTLILVHAPKDNKFCIQDCTCVLENMFIAATALGVGSCWINQVDDLLNSENGQKVKKSLGIPKENRVVGTCILGYPSIGYTPKPKERKADFIKYK